MQVILYRPQIPANTGNILRTCAVTDTSLGIIEPAGFHLSDGALRRAGLHYWLGVDVTRERNLQALLSPSRNFFFFSRHATRRYDSLPFTKESQLIFGSETEGLPQEFHDEYEAHFATIPLLPEAGCLNLSIAVGVVLFEALRQLDFSLFHDTLKKG